VLTCSLLCARRAIWLLATAAGAGVGVGVGVVVVVVGSTACVHCAE